MFAIDNQVGTNEKVLGRQFLDSLVVRISACHVEGPGSIPGRGGFFFHKLDMTTVVKFCRYTNITNRARVAQSVER